MKKSFIYAGAILAATISLTNCTKEINSSEAALPEGIPFEICANPTTKTAVEGLSTKWVAGDALNLFHAEAGSMTYKSDGSFSIAAGDLESKTFKGTLASDLGEGNYDWYAFYPYSKYNKTPAGSSQDDFGFTTIGGTSQTQIGNNSTAHLCGTVCPLYGVAKSVASSATPGITMKHLTSIIEVNVTNNSGKDLSVSSVSFTGTEDIVGTYYINFTQTPVVYTSRGETYVSNTASLSVTGGETIADGASAKFYIAIKPFTAPDGSSLTLSVNGYKKKVTLTKDIVFTAGHIKTINFNFDKVVADYVTIPWTEDFSGDLGIYSLVSTSSDTKTYNENTAGGESPELLVAKNNGSFSAKVKASTGKYLLTFKSNHADYLSISVDKLEVILSKVSDSEYNLTIPEGVAFFNITFTNTNSSNTRLDDISLKTDERTTLTKPSSVMAELNSDTPNSIDVVWASVDNAGSYVVTATPATGNSVNNIVTADGSDSYFYTITGLAYETEYTISVVAKPSDTSLYLDSAAGEAEQPVTTGVKPTGGETVVKTYRHVFVEKPSTGGNVTLSGVSWNITATNLGGYNSNNYAGVQIGTSKKDGQITLTSPSAWSYTADDVTVTKIKEVRLWLNLGGTSVTPSVTIGGKAANSDGTKVTQNKNAVKDWTKTTKVTFTPAAGSDTGVIVIDVKSVKAGYICAIEIDAE